jgi:hypothetical protein
MSSYVQYGQIPFSYMNGLGISNRASSTAIIDVAPGSTIDSTQTFQITTTSTLSASISTVGFGGLDTGTIAASSVYALYLVWDPVNSNPPGLVYSLSYTGPKMPFGYSAYKLLGYVTTSSGSVFLQGYWTAGNDNKRYFYFDSVQNVLTSGSSTTPATVNLATVVPNKQKTNVIFTYNYTSGTAGNQLVIYPLGTIGGTPLTVAAQVAGVAQYGELSMLTGINGSAANFRYTVTATGSANIFIYGYSFDV